ncbi:MAG: HAD-IA family hydrolase [Bdellovibrionales bacterium]|nr:HAD-IA family hydrolase [Bdellovibrionales bacterium]NQZ18916.1 HAD-IA family hydrolase [Bdellovibrionales bacterium]
MSYKLVIFDLGNVLINIHFDQCFRAWSKKSGLEVSKISSWFSEDEMYQKHERGQITGHDYFEYVNQSLNMGLSYEDFLEGWNSIFGVAIKETAEFIEAYSSKIQMCALTNSNKLHRDAWTELYRKELSRMDKVFCSSLIQTRKPEPYSYNHVLNEMNITASEAIFLDDKLENIEAARELGINSILFDNSVRAISSLVQEVSN